MDLVVLIDSPDFKVASTSPLLKRRDAAVVTEASELLKRAQARDQLLLDQTVTAFEQSRQRGFDQGMAEAREAMANRLASALAARQVALQDLMPTLVDIVADAVALLAKNTPRRALLGGALDTVSGMLRQARWARLRVHPGQADEARAALAEARGDLAAVDMVTVIGDATIDADGCIFETDVGIADASLGVQLAAIRSAVGSSLKSIVDAAAVMADTAADTLVDPSIDSSVEPFIGPPIEVTE